MTEVEKMVEHAAKNFIGVNAWRFIGEPSKALFSRRAANALSSLGVPFKTLAALKSGKMIAVPNDIEGLGK